ncbi:RNase adapter RapZ [Nitriliruptoraceae bacterium ZYF776]|nr:RNase adapter RapZ [Profundirhabdus halotolerans]
MSGAGRTEVSKVLEDHDWFVIDNLPPTLLGKVTDLAFAPGSSVSRLALVADVRGREFFGELLATIAGLREAEGHVRVLFLEASDDVLVRRFEATRRRHPASAEGILEGIQRERQLMAELRGTADVVIDTSSTNVHELRDKVTDILGTEDQAALQLTVESFGFKHGAPRDADLVLDVRFLPNPHWVDDLRPLTGRDEPVRDYVMGQEETGPYLRALEALLDASVPGYVREGKRYLTIAIGCTGGKHRSVAVTEHVAEHLRRTTDLPIAVEHRDLGRE